MTAGGLLGAVLVLLVARLFWVQVIHHRDFDSKARVQHQTRAVLSGRRGDVTDRHGRVLVHTLDGRRVKLVDGCHVVGELNAAGEGVEGIERTMDAYLAAEDGWELRLVDALGKPVPPPPSEQRAKPPRHGDRVELTIDARLQWWVEEALAAGVESWRARGGSAIVVHAATGEILAMAATGGTPATGRRGPRLRAVEDLFEPGSTFKLTTFAAALDLELIDDDWLCFAEQGQANFGGFTIRDVKKRGWLSTADVLALSSNICTAKIGEQVGPEQLHRYASALGFGQRTRIELPGEQAGILRPVDAWSGRSTATVAIGQEVSVTAIQLAMAYAAVANGGTLLRPMLVRAVRRPDGSVRSSRDPEVVRRVMRPEVAATLRRYLARAVAEGTGGQADPGVFTVAGKTGTAQKARIDGRGYAEGSYVSCFAGYFPSDDPELVVTVVIDEPRGGHYGGEVAGPVFAEIARGAASMVTRLATTEIEVDAAALHADARGAGRPPAAAPTTVVPDVRSVMLASAVEVIEKRGLRPTVVSAGARVARQDPAPGTPVSPGAEVRIGGEEDPRPPAVPDVIGLTLREALQRLQAAGLDVRARGSGRVIRQDPRPGSPLEHAGRCRLWLEARR